MSILFLLASLTAHAAEHTDTFASESWTATLRDYCVANIVTADVDGTLTQVQAWVDEDETGTPDFEVRLWSRVGAGAWSRATVLDEVTITTSTAHFEPTSTLHTALTAGTTYAIGYCSTDHIDFDYNPTDVGMADPSWGTMEGYIQMAETDTTPNTIHVAAGVYMKITIDAEDADRDGSDAIDDCDDGDSRVHPGAAEVWYDGEDEDCDGGDDDDQDGDGHPAASEGGDDCDDTDPDAHPGQRRDDWYDGVDSDCAGNSDYDQDGDGDDAASWGGGDCDDLDPNVSSRTPEVWYDGVDEDCDGASDYDQDGDGHDAQSAGGDDADDADGCVPDACSGSDGGSGGGGAGTGSDDGAADDTGAAATGPQADGFTGGPGTGGCGGGNASLLLGLAFLPRRRVMRGR